MSRSVDRYRGALLGLAAGDAVGTTLEFSLRGTFEPIEDMVGGGPFNLQPGQWTDDTSMALCLATSLLECGGFDPRDQMVRYCMWWRKGYMSSTGRCFDIGSTTRSALSSYERTREPFSGSTDRMSAGNGSIMRLAPVPLYYHPDAEKAVHYAGESSRTTHGTAECVDACKLFAVMITAALSGESKQDVLFADRSVVMPNEIESAIAAIASGLYRTKTMDEIKGSGYVVKSLEAALWCFWTTSGFEEAILQAANLGDDADTTAAVCGQIAGAYYGAEGIPSRWLARLALLEEICELADRLAAPHSGGANGAKS